MADFQGALSILILQSSLVAPLLRGCGTGSLEDYSSFGDPTLILRSSYGDPMVNFRYNDGQPAPERRLTTIMAILA
jgi:hypothetical protein